MIQKSKAQSSSLFLMEIILAILFFSITSAVCVQIFVKSHLMSQESQALTQAVNECSAVAEICKTSADAKSALELIAKVYPDANSGSATAETDVAEAVAKATDADVTVYYDENFSQCSADKCSYRMTVRLSQSNDMLSADISYIGCSDDKEIYNLDTRNHISRRTTR